MATVTQVRSDAEIQRDVLQEHTWQPRVQTNEIGEPINPIEPCDRIDIAERHSFLLASPFSSA